MGLLMDKLVSKLSSIFKANETSSNWSSIRVAFIYTVLVSNLVFWGIWGWLSLAKHECLRVPQSVILIYASANGISTGGKIWQKNQEAKKNIT
jgi:hypothetical protein